VPVSIPEHDFTEHPLESTPAYSGSFLKVSRDRVRLPDGKEAEREYIHHPGAVAIIPLLDENTVLMEYQYRYPNRQHYWEIPAGKLDGDEDPLVAGQRELLEETGYQAKTWKKLATLHLCIAYSTEKMHYYLAEGLSFHQVNRDDEEFLAVVPMPLTQAWRWIEEGLIIDSKTVVGLLWLKDLRAK
jgi:ADP-ribose pyrophosphatase